MKWQCQASRLVNAFKPLRCVASISERAMAAWVLCTTSRKLTQPQVM